MPRRINIEKRKQQLAEAVWVTIRERGIGAVSVRTVAAQAGVAVGSLRHIFPTRTELLRFSADLMVHRATERVLATPLSGEPVTDAIALLRHMLPLEPDSRAELEVNIALIAESPALPEVIPLRDHAYGQLRLLCERVVAMVAEGIDETGRSDEARRLHALIDGIALHQLMEPFIEGSSWAEQALRDEITRIAQLGAE